MTSQEAVAAFAALSAQYPEHAAVLAQCHRLNFTVVATSDGPSLVSKRTGEPSDVLPYDEQVAAWAADGVCEAGDGCQVEPDGMCPHRSPSWLRRLRFL